MGLNRCGMWSFFVALAYVTTAVESGPYEDGIKKSSWGRETGSNFECKEEGYHADPRDCKLYYRCVDWGQNGALTKFKFECGPGTVFSKERGDVCTFPNESGREECGGSDESDKTNDVDSNNTYDPEKEEQANWRPDSPDPPYEPSYGSSPGPSYVPTAGPSYGSSSGPSYGSSPSPSYGSSPGPSYVPSSPPPPPPPSYSTAAPSKSTSNWSPEQSSSTSASWTTESTNKIDSQSPTSKECQTDGFMSDPEDCRKFYRCVDQGTGSFRKHEFNCGEGTVWDPQIEACNHPWAAKRTDCRMSSSNGNGENENSDGSHQPESNPNPNVSTTPPTPPCTTKKPPSSSGAQQGYPGNVPATNPPEETTSGPVQPEGGSGQGPSSGNEVPETPESSNEVPKPPGTEMNDVSQSPETTTSSSETSGKPNEGSQQTESSKPGSPPLSSGEACTSEGFFGDAEDCSKFYRCVGSGSKFTKYEFKCGDGTVWDDKIASCNHKYAVPRCAGADQATDSGNQRPEESNNEIGTDQGNESGNEGPGDTDNEVGQGPDSGSSPVDSTNNSGQPPSSTDETTESSKITEAPVNGGEAATTDSSQVTESSSQVLPAEGTTPGSSDSGTTSQNPPSTGSSGNKKCKSEGFFADPKDCTKFYRCVGTCGKLKKYEFQCGEGTAWDEKISSCNHKSSVPRCGGNDPETGAQNQRPDETNNEVAPDQGTESGNNESENPNNGGEQGPDSGSSSGDSTTSSGQPPHGTSESSKMTEGPGNAGEPTTPDSSRVTESSSQDVPPAVTSPGSSDSGTTSQEPPSTGSSGNGECTSEGFFPDPEDCNKFYRCVGSGSKFTKYEFHCGEGTVWDERISSCNHKSAVPRCGGSDQGTGTENQRPDETNNEIGPDQGTGNEGNQPDNTNNEAGQAPETGSSSIDSTTTSAQPSSPTTGTTESSKVTEDTTSSGETPAAPTSSSQVTESSSASTAGPEETTPENPPSSGSSGKGECTQEGFYPDPENCKKFYRCVAAGGNKFTKYEFNCGEGTVWDAKIQSCNHAYAVPGCGGKGDGQPSEGYLPSGSSPSDNGVNVQTETSTEPESSSESTTSSSSEQEPSSTTQATEPSTESTSAGGNEPTSESSPMPEPPTEPTEITTTAGGNEPTSELSPMTESPIEPSEGTTSTEEPTSQSSPMTESPTETSEGTTSAGENKPATQGTTSSGENEVSTESSSTMQPSSQPSEGTTSSSESSTMTQPPTQPSEGTTTEAGNESPNESSSASPSSSTSADGNVTPDSSQTSTTSSPMTTQSSDGSSSGQCNSEGFFPNKNDCRKFYRCVNAGNGRYTKYDFSCAPGTAWDDKLTTCNYIHLVASCKSDSNNEIADGKEETGKSTTSTPGGSSTSGMPNDGSTKEPSSTESNPTTSGKPAEVTKPDESTSESSSESTSESSSSSSESTSESSSSSPESTSESSSSSSTSEKPCDKPKPTGIVCNDEGFKAHPTRCDKFYRCVNNGNGFNVYHFDCPPGTIFDPSISVCNYPESVYPARDCQTGGEAAMGESTESSTGPSSSEPTTSTESSSTTGSGEDMTSTTEMAGEMTTEESSTGTSGSTESAGTEGTTETSGESTTEMSTESAGESTTEMSTESAGESTTEMSTESAGESTTEMSTESAGESTTEMSTESAGESTTEMSTESAGETTTEMSTESAGESTTEMSTESAGESTTEMSTESAGESTTEMSTESAGESTTEMSTESAGESTTEMSTESSGETTTESEEPSTTETQQETTESSEGTSTTNEPEESTSMSTESNESTTQEIPPGATPCPIGNLTGEQIVLVCPTGFKRHPKYCNIFYQCISESATMEIKILSFSCPENTIFDEEKIQCLPESESNQPCTGVKAGARFYRRIESSSTALMRIEKRETLCPGVGHYPYREGCSNVFYKCKRDSRDALQGYLYKCPEDFVYWSVSRRCERATRLPMCASRTLSQKDKNENDTSSSRWQLPIEDYNLSARMLRYPY